MKNKKVFFLIISSLLIILVLVYTFIYLDKEDTNYIQENNEETILPSIKYGIPANVISVFIEDKYLKIKTDSNSYCEYSNINCNYSFAEGIRMPYDNTQYHITEWSSNNTYYIKCSKNNTGLINECSKIISCENYKNFTGCSL